MSVKSKKTRKMARNAALSALIVSAIVGSGGVASAAPTHDNLSITESAAFGRVTTDGKAGIVGGTVQTSTAGNGTIGGLKVSGGSLYVNSNLTVSGKPMGANNANAWVTGGQVVVGQHADGKVASGVALSVDNMTIDGGLVVVTNNAALNSGGDININGGKLQLSGDGTNLASGSIVQAANVNINAGGTLEASQGEQNVVKASASVNLNGGTITVAKDAGLTITKHAGSWDPDAAKGYMVVGSLGAFKSQGGTINANVMSKGTSDFVGGTTTVDNLTVADGITTIRGNAVVNAKGDAAIEGGTLRMKGGTLRMKGGEGTLSISGSGTLHSSANVNTVDGNVKITSAGASILVAGNSELTITKKLDVTAGFVSVNEGSTLAVKGLTTLAAHSVTVGGTNSGDLGIFSITKESLFKKDTNGKLAANEGIEGNAIGLNNQSGAATTVHNGMLILTGWSGEVDTVGDFASGALNGVTNGVLGGSLTGNNIILMGATLKGVDAKIDTGTNADLVAYGSAVTVANTNPGGTFTNTGTIIVPKLVQGTGVTEYINSTGKTTLVGTGAVDSTTTFTKYTQSGAGTTTIMGGAGLIAHEVAISAGAVSVEAGSSLNTSSVNMSGGLLSVTNSTANIGTLKATSGTIFIDPAYVNVGNITDSLGAQLLTGSGSVLNVGGAAGWMNKPMADAGFSYKNPDQAILGLAPTGTIKVDATGIIAVDPTLAKNSPGTGYVFTNASGVAGTEANQKNLGQFYAGAGSLTVLDVSALDGKPVFDLNKAVPYPGTANIVDGAKLHVVNLTVKDVDFFTNSGGSVSIADGKGEVYDPTRATKPNTGWAGKNLIQPDRMLSASMSKEGTLDAEVNSASAVFGMSSEFEGLMQGVWGLALNNTNSANAGIRLVSRAASTDYGMSADQVAKTIEGAAQLGAVAGVQGVTMGAANAATSAVATRTSFAQPLLDKSKAVALNMDSEGHVSVDSGLSAGEGMKNGLALWIMPLYQSNNVWGQDAGNFQSGYNSDLGGVAAGVDYTVNDMFRFGAALNIGAGYSQSNGDFSSTDNNFNFWGVNLYGGWTMNNFGLTADVGYTGNYNAVEQDAPAALGMSNFKSDINSSAWTVGLKAEYKIETSVLDIIPHVGVRYMGLTTEQYDVKGGGGTVFDVEENVQSIWTFPIGVALSKTFETGSGPSGWTFKPQVDLAVIPAAGDVEARSTSRIPGAPGSAEAKMQVVDYVTFDGGVGFEFGNENLNFGLNYNIQASEHRTGHGVFGTVRYEF